MAQPCRRAMSGSGVRSVCVPAARGVPDHYLLSGAEWKTSRLSLPLGCMMCAQVKQIQDFKRSLPKETKLIVCKNTLLKRAADEVEGWQDLKPAAKVQNVGEWG